MARILLTAEEKRERKRCQRLKDYRNNREKDISRSKKWAVDNPDKVRANGRRAHYVNSDNNKIYKAKYYKDNKDKIIASTKAKYVLNPDLEYTYSLPRKYGISIEQLNIMLVNHCHKCAICGISDTQLNRKLCIDHCHETKIVRGLLCSKCNMALGSAMDSVHNIELSIKYIVDTVGIKYDNPIYISAKDPLKVRKNHLRHCYGLSLSDYDNMHSIQEGCCAICGRHHSEFKINLSVDHCHETGKIRGLLCTHCNTSIGRFKEDVTIMQSAIDYLNKYSK